MRDMKLETIVTRSPKDRRLPSSIIEPQERGSHRPKNSYRILLRNEDDVLEARKLGLPLFLLKDTMVTIFGYPMRFPSMIIMPKHLRSAVSTRMPIVEFVSDHAASVPRFEDVVIAMLKFDPIAGRVLAQRNLDILDRDYLVKRIYQEDLERIASLVRLQDVPLPLPIKGEQLPKEAMDRLASSNQSKGALP